jgi:two-component system, LytTR family, response regulator
MNPNPKKRALIIDDERLARQELKNLLSDFPDIEIVGEAENADEAEKQIDALKPDILFLDIQMPGKNGFDLINDLDRSPEIIFVSAYDEYALRAFEVNALDYLLKPVQPERLKEALSKIGQPEKEFERPALQNNQLGEEDQVFVKDGEKCWFVSSRKEIMCGFFLVRTGLSFFGLSIIWMKG